MVAATLSDASESAAALMKSIDAVVGCVSIAATTEPNGSIVLRVWLRAGTSISKLPSTFAGYPVRVERVPEFKAEADCL